MLFISYSHKNREIAAALHQCMLKCGYQSNQIFKDDDPRNGIVAGSEWQKELVQNIRGARALIVLVSPEWFQSKWCFAELAFAKSSPHKPAIIPLVIEELSEKDWVKSGLDPYQKSKYSPSDPDKIEEEIKLFVERELKTTYPPTLPLQRHRESYPQSSEFRFQNYEDWGTDNNMQTPMVLSEVQKTKIARIKQTLKDPAGPLHIHIYGVSGIGKTRLVYEALSSSDHSEKVIYYDSPQTLRSDPYFRQLSSLESEDKAIVVVDDCLRGENKAIATQVSKCYDRMKLITIALADKIIGDSKCERIEIEPLDKNAISEIIRSYLPPATNVSEFAVLCEGSARFAHLVGESLSKSSSILELPNREVLLQKIITCGLEPQSEQAQKRITVARFISVFSSFGFKPPYQEDTESLSRFISSFHPSIGLGDLLDVVHSLRERRILQGKTTLYFSTPILSWQLWDQWWGIYGTQFRIQNLLDLSPYLQEKIADNWRQIPLSSRLSEIASSLVMDTGFRDPSVCSRQFKSVRQLLDAVSDFCPGVVVEAIWQIYFSWDRNTPGKEEFFSFLHEFTRVIARNIDSVDHFLICVRLLEALSLSGIADCLTAKEVLARFFCVNTRKDEKYFPYPTAIRFLETGFEHGGIERKILLIGVCKSVILTTQFDSLQAIQYIDFLWKHLNEELCSIPDSSEKTKLIEESFECIRGLFFHPESHKYRLSTMEWILNSSEADRSVVLRWIDRYWKQSSEKFSNYDVRKSLKRFYQKLIGNTLETKLFAILSIFENTFHEDREDTTDVLVDIELELQEIGRELVLSGDASKSHIEKLVNSNLGESLVRLGKEISANDSDFKALAIITTAMSFIGERSNALLITGYLNHLRELDQAKHGSVLDELPNKIPCVDLNLEILLRSPHFLPSTALRVSDLILVHNANPEAVAILSSADLRAFDSVTIQCFVAKLLNNEKIRSANAASKILYRRYFSEEAPDIGTVNLMRDVALSEVFWPTDAEDARAADKICFTWIHLIKKFVVGDSDASCVFAKRFFAFMSAGLFDRFFYRESDIETAFDDLVRSNFAGLWDCFFEALELNDNKAASRLFRWISQSYVYSAESDFTGYWCLVPLDRLFGWVDLDRAKRVRLVCSSLPSLINERGVFEPTKAFLVRYWDLDPCCWEKVRDVSPSGVYGSLSDYYLRRISWVVEALEKEKDSIVETWLQTMLESYTKELERAKEDEGAERERFFTRFHASDSST